MQSYAAASRFHALAAVSHVEVHLLPLKSSYSESTWIKTGMLNSSNNKSPLFSALPTALKILSQVTPELVYMESAHGGALQRPHPDKEDPCCLS